MLLKSIERPLLRVGRLAHAHLIWNHAPAALREDRDKVAVQVAPGRVPMHHHYRLATSFIYEVYVDPIDSVIVRGKREGSFKGLIFERKHRKSPGVCIATTQV